MRAFDLRFTPSDRALDRLASYSGMIHLQLDGFFCEILDSKGAANPVGTAPERMRAAKSSSASATVAPTQAGEADSRESAHQAASLGIGAPPAVRRRSHRMGLGRECVVTVRENP